MTKSTHSLVVILTGNPKSKDNQLFLRYFRAYAEMHNFNVETIPGSVRFLERYREKNPKLYQNFYNSHQGCGSFPVVALVNSEDEVLATQSRPSSFNNLGLHCAVSAQKD